MDAFANKPLSEINEADLNELIRNAVAENNSLDYKLTLDLSGERERREFLFDITSFANARGGLIIAGVEEERDTDGRSNGIPKSCPGLSVPNKDALTTEIDALLRDCVDERLPGVQTHFIPLANGNSAILLRIPMSTRAPHMAVYRKQREFYLRVNGGKEPMSTAQIRDAVTRTDVIERQIRALVAGRVEEFKASALGKPFWTLHVIPLFSTSPKLDLANREAVQRLKRLRVPMIQEHHAVHTHCLEGLRLQCASFGNGTPPNNHTLVLRDGSIECAASWGFIRSDGNFHPWQIRKEVAECLSSILKLYRDVGPPLPAAVFLTLGNFDDCVLAADDDYGMECIRKPMPGGLIPAGHEIVDSANLDPNAILRRMFDVVWQSAGLPRCPEYDDKGKFLGPKGMLARLS